MDAPTLKRAASAVTMGLGGLLWLAAILFMAQTAQNSEQFSRLHPWILGINIAGLVVLVGLLAHEAHAADPRLARPRHRLAAQGAHGLDLRRARDAADPARVLLRGAVPEQGHRQLVQRRDPPEPRRRTGAVALGAGSAHARAPRGFRSHRRGNRHRGLDDARAARNDATAGRRGRTHGGDARRAGSSR